MKVDARFASAILNTISTTVAYRNVSLGQTVTMWIQVPADSRIELPL